MESKEEKDSGDHDTKWLMQPTCIYRSEIPASGELVLHLTSPSPDVVAPPLSVLRPVICGNTKEVTLVTCTSKHGTSCLQLHIQWTLFQHRSLALLQLPQFSSGDSESVLHTCSSHTDIHISLEKMERSTPWFEDWFRVVDRDLLMDIPKPLFAALHGKTFADLNIEYVLGEMVKELEDTARASFMSLVQVALTCRWGGERVEIARERQVRLLQVCIWAVRAVGTDKENITMAIQESMVHLLWSIYLFHRAHGRAQTGYHNWVLQVLDFLLAFGHAGRIMFARICKEEMKEPRTYWLAFRRPLLSSGYLAIAFTRPGTFLALRQEHVPADLSCLSTTGIDQAWHPCSHRLPDDSHLVNLFCT